jgi:hypothetical protein
MGMYVCPCDKANVVAFLEGYQIGTGGECRFTNALSDCLAKRYRIKPGPLGWAHQILRLAEKRSLDWMEMYLIVSSEVLNETMKAETREISR